MALALSNLDDETRRHMVAEMEHDLAANTLYTGKYLRAPIKMSFVGVCGR
jgi:hypothetical protein